MALSYLQAKKIFDSLTDVELRKASPLISVEGLAKYCPHKPLPKQQLFLDLTCLEALYGGAAGPGKTDALLMAALQYVHVPGYSALILRRDFARLALPKSIMDRAREWLQGTDAKWNGTEHSFRFPSGAVIQFGYIDSPNDRFRYASAEFQFIAWDEMTEFQLPTDGENNPYEFLFSRLRRPVGMPVPLRVRAGSNPGNIGHQYVKRRFVTEEALAHLREGGEAQVFYTGKDRSRAFVPALLEDNPFIDRETYVKGLMYLPAVTRARLLSGDWSVIEEALIRAEWLRLYRMRGQVLQPLGKDGAVLRTGVIDEREAYRFATIDTAGTSKQKAAERKGKPASWSVCQIWDFWPRYKLLFLRHVWRARVDWHGLKAGVSETLAAWSPKCGYIENAHHGPPLFSELQGEFPFLRLVNPVMPFMKGQGGVPGKVERATPLLTMLEKGQVFLPEGNTSWLPDLEAEWLSWTGDEDETADQVDCAAYAAALDHVHQLHGEVMRIESVLSR